MIFYPFSRKTGALSACPNSRRYPNLFGLGSVLVLAFLVGYRAGSFAGRLAGGLAFAAAAFRAGFFQIGFIDSFDMFHD
jgi:hypothetical protein